MLNYCSNSNMWLNNKSKVVHRKTACGETINFPTLTNSTNSHKFSARGRSKAVCRHCVLLVISYPISCRQLFQMRFSIISNLHSIVFRWWTVFFETKLIFSLSTFPSTRVPWVLLILLQGEMCYIILIKLVKPKFLLPHNGIHMHQLKNSYPVGRRGEKAAD